MKKADARFDNVHNVRDVFHVAGMQNGVWMQNADARIVRFLRIVWMEGIVHTTQNGGWKRAGGCKRRMHVCNVVCAQKKIMRKQKCHRASQLRDPLGTTSILGEWAAPRRPFEEAWNKGAGMKDKGAHPKLPTSAGIQNGVWMQNGDA